MRMIAWKVIIASFVISIPAISVFGQISDPAGNEPPQNAVWLETMNLTDVFQGRDLPKAGKSVFGNQITISGKVFAHGIGVRGDSKIFVDLKGAATQFTALLGVDDGTTSAGLVNFEIWVDKKKVESSTVKKGEPAKPIAVNLKGAKQLILITNPGTNGDSRAHADWAGAALTIASGAKNQPSVVSFPNPQPAIASGVSPAPSINGPSIVGTTPGKPFIFLIPATGQGKLTYSAKGLPAGLKLNATTGIITGSLKNAGSYIVAVTVKGPKGVAQKNLTIVGGEHKLALTPPMGWNSWNCWASAVDDAKVRAAADWMVRSGLASHGYQYINIDDCWEADRDANGEILCNEKFPDMKALADYVHSKGLKLGIYSSPGTKTCAGYTASYQHEQQDAQTYAKWGIDYLKYDWCSYSDLTGYSYSKPVPSNETTLPVLQKPYSIMHEALDKTNRDIVFSLCQYGMGDVWEWGDSVGGNLWRTTGDINDSWESLSGIGFNQDGHEKYAGPGHWNDPDMLIVGKVGWGPNLHPTKLTYNEQVTHISLWCLQSAPLLIGCDMSAMEQFTIDLLSNDELIAIDQDALGKPAGRIVKDPNYQVWARTLADGTKAVGLFNTSVLDNKVTVKWSDLGISGKQAVRNLWLKKALGKYDDSFTAEVPAHGAVVIKIGTPKKG